MASDMPPSGDTQWVTWLVEHLWMALAAVGAWIFRDLHKRLTALEVDRGTAAEQRAIANAQLEAIDKRTQRIEQLLDAQYRYSLQHGRSGESNAQD